MTTNEMAKMVGLFGMILFGSRMEGSLVAPKSILELEQTSDLVVAASASGAVASGNTVSFSIQVARVIKGDSGLAGRSIASTWITGGQGAPVGDQNVKYAGLWFLKQAGNAWRVNPVMQGTAVFTDIYIPSPAGPIVSAYAYNLSTASVTDKLSAELCSTIENGNANSFFMYALHAGGLAQFDSPMVQLLYRRLSSSSSPEQKALGLSGLIRGGAPSSIVAAAQLVSTLQDGSAMGVLLLNIRDSFRATDSVSVNSLGQSATDSTKPLAFREAAAHALAAIHTATALPFLAALLDDPERSLRVEAVGGLGAFANGLSVQTSAGVPSLSHLQFPDKAPYKTAETVAHLAMGWQAIAPNEASYLSYWKAWWAEHKASLGY